MTDEERMDETMATLEIKLNTEDDEIYNINFGGCLFHKHYDHEVAALCITNSTEGEGSKLILFGPDSLEEPGLYLLSFEQWTELLERMNVGNVNETGLCERWFRLNDVKEELSKKWTKISHIDFVSW